MPKFLYTTVIVSLLLWLSAYKYIFYSKPSTFLSIFIFLLLIFFAVLATASIPLYFYFHYKAPTFSNLRQVYRKSLRWSAYLSFGLVFLMMLRTFKLDHIANIALFLIFYILLYFQLRLRR